jgi:hypothetical protein
MIAAVVGIGKFGKASVTGGDIGRHISFQITALAAFRNDKVPISLRLHSINKYFVYSRGSRGLPL